MNAIANQIYYFVAQHAWNQQEVYKDKSLLKYDFHTDTVNSSSAAIIICTYPTAHWVSLLHSENRKNKKIVFLFMTYYLLLEFYNKY
jgi:hypothetical protein